MYKLYFYMERFLINYQEELLEDEEEPDEVDSPNIENLIRFDKKHHDKYYLNMVDHFFVYSKLYKEHYNPLVYPIYQ